jgi:glutaredoxin
MRRSARFLFLLLFSTPLLAQSLYKSVGPDGKIVYSDHPPAEGRVLKTMRFENLPTSALPAAATEQLRRQKAQSTAAAPGGIVLYTAAWCGYCKKAKAYLASKGIDYQEFDIDTEQGMISYAQAGGGKGIPLLLYGGQRIQGFSTAAYEALFASRK